MKASIIIRTKNEERYLNQTLRRILDQEFDGEYEVIVVDSGSTDGTLDIFSRYPIQLVEISSDSFTYGYALNVGARKASGDYLVNLSAHCIPVDEHWLRDLIHPLEEKSSVIVTYGRQIPIKGLNPFEEVKLEVLFPPHAEGAEAQKSFSNSNCALRREIWEEHPFDERISIMEDKMWYQEVKQAGEVLYVPQATVYHSHPLDRQFIFIRAFKDGLAHVYAQGLFGLDISPREYTTWSWIRRSLLEHHYWLSFLVRHRYWLHVLLYFPYQLFHRWAFERGLREGRRRFGRRTSSGQASDL